MKLLARFPSMDHFHCPLTSLPLGALFLLASAVVGGGANSALLSASLAWLGYINILVGVFNLLPAFPLDGGRILQSLIRRGTGDRLRATRIAARIGMAFAFLFIAYGLITSSPRAAQSAGSGQCSWGGSS